MPAYVCVDIDIHDPATYDEYKKLAPAAIAAFGGRYLTRGGEVQALEGDWHPKRFVLVEFPSVARARAWWASPEYAQAKALRQASATSRMLLLEGLPADWKP